MIRKVITYSLLFTSILYIYREFLYVGVRKNKLGIFNKYNELFLEKNKNYNALFLGSSRAEMHFHPKIFDTITGLNSFNLGISGASPRISYSMLKTYCSRHQTPKYIVLNIDYFSLKSDLDMLNDFPRYFPYLSNKFLKRELYNMDNRFNSFYYNPIHSLPYTQFEFLSASLHGWLNIYGRYDTLMYKGFQTTESNEVSHIEQPVPKYSFISIKNRKYIDSIILFAKEKNINLVLITAPVFGRGLKNVTNKSILTRQLDHIAFINHIKYIDYSDSLKFDNPLFFADNEHLNLKGASEFSKSFSFTFNTIFPRKALFNK
ncbi:MAG: hypothetical protein V4565_05530 [Bacteroidota bacterium]